MIKIENIETYGWQSAIRGMRNPMNSWDKSDSIIDDIGLVEIGPNDLELMKKLVKAGTDHRKFLRMINVTMDITAPLYWWKEFDTYKVGTVRNSCSTMHKIAAKEFELDDFSHEHLMGPVTISSKDTIPIVDVSPYHDEAMIFGPKGWLEGTICMLNACRKWYLESKDKKYWWQLIQLLPSSYNQKATVQVNYEVLLNMYHSRKNHKLDEWREFCETIKKLPYLEVFIDD